MRKILGTGKQCYPKKNTKYFLDTQKAFKKHELFLETQKIIQKIRKYFEKHENA